MILEMLGLVARWIHVIAGIMWIGDSFLFMWLDRQLEPRGDNPQVVGEMWMVHSGGFYEVVKRKYLKPNEMPKSLHWFKWESYTTWISGACLLVIVYYMGGAVYLVDPTTSTLSHQAAIAIGVCSILAAWVVYDLLAYSPLAKNNKVFGAVGVPAITAVAFAFTRVFTGRAAFLHLGALLATIMALNVFMRIIPAQRALLAATNAGGTPDVSLGVRAKLRSTHNHYLTLPVLFMMLSNHFPTTYGHSLNWLLLGVLVVCGMAIKQAMIKRTPLMIGAAATALAVVAFMTAPTGSASVSAGGEAVAFARVREIVNTRCVGCHAEKPTTGGFLAPPSGVVFESNAAVKSFAERIKIRAVVTKTMPLGNLTGITDEERELLGRWVDQGAKVE